MIDDPNPYQAPIADPESMSAMQSDTNPSGPQGFPGPFLLAWTGLTLAAGLVISFFLAASGVSSMMLTLAIPPARLAWIVLAGIQQRRYQVNWTRGARTFLFTTWVLNITLLLLDATLVVLAAVCIAALSNASN